MSKGFSINDILGSTKTNAPAGQKMQVVMLPAADIEPNPENSIYEIGDVSMLKADIAERGLRSPLEVLPARTGKYMLLAGHRRWTACRALTAEGVAGFEVLPCVIRQSQGEDDDLIALITSNATARELTDGERLRQYRALKQALERKKAAGALDGRIRDEMSRITGDGTGTLGRLNAIANNCVPEVLAMVERGEITMTRAYECSKLYKVQQVEYAKIKYASMPPITDMARRAAIKYLVECGLADQLKKLDYTIGGNFIIFAGNNVRIEGFGPKIDGKYFVDKTTRTIDRNGFSCKIEASGIDDPFYAWQVGGSIQIHEKSASETATKYDSTYETTKPAASAASTTAAASAGTTAGTGGRAVSLKNCPLYYTSTVKTKTTTVSGTYYLYDGTLVAGRYRITNTKERCGKLPMGKNVTGWVDAKYIK